jgi:phospholipid transport system substrate-binding protein
MIGGRIIARRTVLAGLLAVPAAARADVAGPAAPVAALLEGLKAAMKAGRGTPFATRAAKLGPVVDRSFDLRAILMASVGPRWAGFAPEAQAALLGAFREFTVASWVANFDADEGQRFEIDPEVRLVGADRIVTTRIVPASGEPTRLDYVMRETGGLWQAVDVLVDGAISRAAVQRSDFRALLRDGNPAGLIQNLRDKAAELGR